ncbi:MAG TPA: hypothetical protein VJW51_01050 [Candidatus Acidoferrales bacterium]|nr:hypothetical protein [Candidatus Acidoferrales bacterium]
MANRAVRERLAQDVSAWLADGLVPKETHDLLRQRYGSADFGVVQAIKSLGAAGGLLAFFGLLGLVAATSGSQLFAAFLLMAVGCGLTAAGIFLATDKLGRYTSSSPPVLLLGVVCATLGIGVALDGMRLQPPTGVFLTGAIVLGPILFLAYRYSNNFLLLLGLVGFFHWVGSWTSMLGRSTYAIAVQDPRLMSVASLGVIALGVYHERNLRERAGRFFQVYETLGLIYLNLSLLILSIAGRTQWGPQGLWILVLFGAAIAQIFAGARLHNSLFTGFGVTSFAVNLFTRYYDFCWNRMRLGTFLFLGGVALFAGGFACEVVLRQWQRAAGQAKT